MPHSHHSHSGQFCRHAAQGTSLEDVVQRAIEKGFKVYGLTEHCPRYRQEDLYPEESDLTPQDLYKTYLDFLTEAHRLKILYSRSITLLVGIETDYITELDLTGLERLLEVEKGRIQFVVGSVHHVRSIPIDFDRPTWEVAVKASGSSLADLKSFFLDYLDEQYTMLQRIQPTVVGHFDLCRLFSPETRLDQDPEVWDKVRRNVEFVNTYGGLFEINAASFRKGWNQAYPGAEVLQLIKATGGKLCLSDDSHGPQAVGLNYGKMKAYLVDQGVKEVWYLTDKPGEDEPGIENQKDDIEGEGTTVALRKVHARQYEGDWAADEFWQGFDG